MNVNFFRRFGIATVAAVYFLILVGGIVRATGSGMGCPDWPLCFGQVIPPTDISQLPPNYKEIYAVAGKEIADFNPVHTWTEYINRLIGVLIGLLIAGTAVSSLQFRKTDPLIMYLAFLSFIFVLFQAWLGSVVVATDLKPVTITVHMIMALVIVMLLMYIVVRSQKSLLPTITETIQNNLSVILWIGIVLMLIQIALGTQVREGVDTVGKALNGADRGRWLELIGLPFYVHRTFSLLIVAVHVFVWLKVRKLTSVESMFLKKWSSIALLLIGSAVISGMIMAYFDIPKAAQPVHLVLSSLIIGVQFLMVMVLQKQRFLGKKGSPVVAF